MRLTTPRRPAVALAIILGACAMRAQTLKMAVYNDAVYSNGTVTLSTSFTDESTGMTNNGPFDCFHSQYQSCLSSGASCIYGTGNDDTLSGPNALGVHVENGTGQFVCSCFALYGPQEGPTSSVDVLGITGTQDFLPPGTYVAPFAPIQGTTGHYMVIYGNGFTNNGANPIPTIQLDSQPIGTGSVTSGGLTMSAPGSANITEKQINIPYSVSQTASTAIAHQITIIGQVNSATTATFNVVPPPTITGISPSQAPVGDQIAVTITGTGFGDSPTVSTSALTNKVTSSTPTSIVVSLTIPDNGTAGNQPISVSVNGVTSAASQFYVQVPTTLQRAGTVPSTLPGVVTNGSIPGSSPPTTNACGVYAKYLYMLMDQRSPAVEITHGTLTLSENLTNISLYGTVTSAPNPTPGSGDLSLGLPSDLIAVWKTAPVCLIPGSYFTENQSFSATIGSGRSHVLTFTDSPSAGMNSSGSYFVTNSITHQ